MKLIGIILLEILILNIQFLLGRFTSFYELQPMVLLVLGVYFILKADEAYLLPALLVTGFFLDCFFSKKFGPYITLLLLSGLLFKDTRNIMFHEHFVTHAFFVFGLTLVGTFIIYYMGGVVAFRAPIILAIYNAILTPFLVFIFNLLRVDNLVREVENV